jgi:uncharacterized protein YaaQ
MSELLIAVVRETHVDAVLHALVADGHRVTGLPSFGGFLREDSRTLFVAIEQDQRQTVLEIFGRLCAGTEVEVPLYLRERLTDWRSTTVHHAGATIFIVPLAAVVRT